jgi:hypothetical protein
LFYSRNLWRIEMIREAVATLALSLVACSGGSDSGDSWSPTDFSGGNFQFTSTDVDDSCTDGAFVAVFLPEGVGSTNAWQYPIEIPAWSNLPATLEIQIQEPLSAMEVTMEEGSTEGLITIASALQTDVEFDADANPGCLVDMAISVELVLDDDLHLHGSATMATGSFDEENCPAVEEDPCQIDLTFTGEAI